MTGMRHVYWCTWWSVLPLKHIFFAAQDMEVAVFRSKWDLGSSNIIWLAEVPGIARVIIRLSAILPTSSLENSSTRVLRSICASRSAHTSRSTRSWSCLNSKLVLPQLEAGLALTWSWSHPRSWSVLHAQHKTGLASTRSWSHPQSWSRTWHSPCTVDPNCIHFVLTFETDWSGHFSLPLFSLAQW